MLAIRYATKLDIEGLLKVSKAVAPTQRGNGFILSSLEYKTVVEELSHFLVIEYRGKIAAFVWYDTEVPENRLELMSLYENLDITSNTLYIKQLAVHPDYQKHGFGKLLYKVLQDEHEGYSILAAVITHPVANIWSMAFHLNIGFSAIGSYMLKDYDENGTRYYTVFFR